MVCQSLRIFTELKINTFLLNTFKQLGVACLVRFCEHGNEPVGCFRL